MIFGSNMPDDKQFLSPASMSVLRSVENISRYSATRICLFGKPDLTETAKMISEQFDSDRQRMLERWGFDILSEKFIANTTNSPKVEKVRKNRKISTENKENIDVTSLSVSNGDRTLVSTGELCEVNTMKKEKLEHSHKKKSLKMSNEKHHIRRARQSHVTDYWRSRKFSESSSCSDKEN